MTYFDTMVKNMGKKDLNAIKEWIHPDYIFVADFEMLTKDDYQKCYSQKKALKND